MFFIKPETSFKFATFVSKAMEPVISTNRSTSSFSISSSYRVPTEINDQLNFINGKRTKPTDSSHKFRVIAPFDGNVLVECNSSSRKDLEDAVESAKIGLDAWSKLTGLERGTILHRAAELIKANLESIAKLETLHNGKPIYESRIDVLYAAECVNYYGSLAPTIVGDHVPLTNGNFVYTRKEPLGVCAGIGAWNYPFQTCSWKCAPALAAGNVFIYKPSPWAPLSPTVLAEIFVDAGLPPGVFNVVQGGRETGEAICENEDVAKVSFTGSVQTGQKIMEVCAQRGLKRVTLELGGKSPLLIFDDAKLDNAIKGALHANYFTQGEVCSNAARVFVQRSIYDGFVEKIVQRVKQLKQGNPFDEDTLIGATITEAHMRKIEDYIETAKKEGATIACGGTRVKPKNSKIANGFYFAPTVVTNANDDMTVVKEEIFGPVMCILPFVDEDEGIRRANNTPYGLCAGVFTNNLQRAHRVAAKLQAGYVWINNFNAQPVEAPFGGYKLSGIGRELGKEGLDAYTQTKSVYVELNEIDSPFVK